MASFVAHRETIPSFFSFLQQRIVYNHGSRAYRHIIRLVLLRQVDDHAVGVVEHGHAEIATIIGKPRKILCQPKIVAGKAVYIDRRRVI